jgi:GT2 family glycosyltransferase
MNNFAVILLNWNGSKDTVECLRSIKSSDELAVPIVVDNNSVDDSLIIIRNEIKELYGEFIECDSKSWLELSSEKLAIPVLLKSMENDGFAAGCNRGLKIANTIGYEITIFLNNDTIVEVNSLSILAERVSTDKDIYVAFPLLTIHNTGKIWNCGGKLSEFGFRKYHYAGKNRSEVIIPDSIICTFFTGCCFAIDTKKFSERGGFTERFFFGEEDFELSFWMKDNDLKAICLTDSIVHHKVSASISKVSASSQASKVFVHYLNRFIHMRLRFGRIFWFIWLAFYIPYIARMLSKNGIIKASEFPSFFKNLVRWSAKSNSVTRQDFQYILSIQLW